MSIAERVPLSGLARRAGMLSRVSAFFRRDLLVMLSYRTAFFTDWATLLMQVFIFSFIGKLIDPSTMPLINGRHPTYLEFVAVGVALSTFIQIGLIRIVRVIREEQMMGTLESLMLTPTPIGIILIGSVIYDVIYVPVRTVIFFLLLWWLFGLEIPLSGLLPAIVVITALIPFVWGLGILSAAAIFTFRRGGGLMGIAGTILTISSGTYFPLSVLPNWLADVAEHNPIAIALQSTREILLGNAGWSPAVDALPSLIPAAILSVLFGAFAFRLALARERRLGTIGAY